MAMAEPKLSLSTITQIQIHEQLRMPRSYRFMGCKREHATKKPRKAFTLRGFVLGRVRA